MTKAQAPGSPGRTIRQQRSRKTYQALIAAGFKLLERHEFESITIADLTGVAGYSVGAFYARFRSKDEFFAAMVAHHLEERSSAQQQLLATAAHDELVTEFVDGIVKYYWKRRRFWRAALMRSTNDPKFWAPIDRNARKFVAAFTDRIETDIGRSLTRPESTNVRFAIHIVLSTINNRIVNRPRPSLLGRPTFIDNLTRAFRLVSDYQSLSKDTAAR
jgi:AcrR family transcriptional regulator